MSHSEVWVDMNFLGVGDIQPTTQTFPNKTRSWHLVASGPALTHPLWARHRARCWNYKCGPCRCGPWPYRTEDLGMGQVERIKLGVEVYRALGHPPPPCFPASQVEALVQREKDPVLQRPWLPGCTCLGGCRVHENTRESLPFSDSPAPKINEKETFLAGSAEELHGRNENWLQHPRNPRMERDF